MLITDIEFYLYSNGICGHTHYDPYVKHFNIRTPEKMVWNFYASDRDNITNLYKHVELTFGRALDYGGILIQGLRRLTKRSCKSNYISGSNQIVNSIMRLSNVKTLRCLTKKYNVTDIYSCSALKLVAIDGCESVPILCPRIGLSKHVDIIDRDNNGYYDRNYRAIVIR